MFSDDLEEDERGRIIGDGIVIMGFLFPKFRGIASDEEELPDLLLLRSMGTTVVLSSSLVFSLRHATAEATAVAPKCRKTIMASI